MIANRPASVMCLCQPAISGGVRRRIANDRMRAITALRNRLSASREDLARWRRNGERSPGVRIPRQLFSAAGVDPGEHLRRTWGVDPHQRAASRDVELESRCGHHRLPLTRVAQMAGSRRECAAGLVPLGSTMGGSAGRPQVHGLRPSDIADAAMICLAARRVRALVEGPQRGMKVSGMRTRRGVLTRRAAGGGLRSAGDARNRALGLPRHAT
ncbi:MAG: GTP cyclohydrolase I [Phycisphaerae bacterium]